MTRWSTDADGWQEFRVVTRHRIGYRSDVGTKVYVDNTAIGGSVHSKWSTTPMVEDELLYETAPGQAVACKLKFAKLVSKVRKPTTWAKG